MDQMLFIWLNYETNMLRYIQLTAVFVLCFIFIDVSIAAGVFPRGCEVTGFGYSHNYLVLNETGDQTLYLIQNRSNTQIELQRYEASDIFLSPKLQSKLAPLNWAAFSSDVANLHFKCYKLENDSSTLTNCSEVLEVCQYPRVKFALSNMGSYWVSTNKPQAQVIKDAAAKGIFLHW